MSETKIININVPEGCQARTNVSPIKVLKGMDYFRIFCDPLQMMLDSKDCTITDMRVMLYLFSIMDFNNRISISQQQLAEDLKTTRPMVWKSLRALQEKDLIHIVEKIGCQNVYMINPNLAFKTRAINLSKLRDTWEEETLTQTDNIPKSIR